MKARLGICTGLLMLPLRGPALADSRQDVLSAVQRCNAFADARTWLDCYYGAAQPMRGQLGLPPAPMSQQQLVPAASANSPGTTMAMATPPPRNKDLWDKLWAADAPPLVNKIAMKEYHFDKRGAFTVTLANGQIWREDPREHPNADWRDRANTYAVTIAPDDSGYRMYVLGDSNSYRVQRVS
jgi:hypothetical protein